MSYQRQFGFSLFELLIVLTLIGILSAISYPLYTRHVLKTHRVQAQVSLMYLAIKLEHYHMLNHSYSGATFINLGVSEKIVHDSYRLSLNSLSDEEFVIQAVPLGRQKQDKCGVLSLDNVGNKMSECVNVNE